MKTMKNILVVMMSIIIFGPTSVVGQKVDDDRMKRDIEVAENVLSTLIKQQFSNQRTFFPLEVKGSYQAGYGITFSLPADFTTPIVFSIGGGNDNVFISGGNNERGNGTSYSYEYYEDDSDRDPNTIKLKDRAKEKKRMDMDSIRNSYNKKVIDAAKTFIADYGDMITQLEANERIVISNRGSQPRAWVGQIFDAPKRTHLSVEGLKSDVTAYRQGKITRDQMLAKLKVINTQAVDKTEPDLELLASMFNRLYSADLSKTFFTENNIYYERLKDFGVIYYMQVFSSDEIDYGRFRMPTIGLNDIDLETRNKKIKELYPKFEQDLKENILEYGRTVKSLGDTEVLVFQVKVTKCPQCGIPSTLEYTVKGDVLRDFNAAKISRDAAVTKIAVKKGNPQ
jgi:hypothetical protein